MKLTRRTFVLGGIAAPLAAQAQTWPSGPVRIVVAYPPGGSTDAIMRLVQSPLQDRLNTTIIIENRAGASGSVGTGWVVKSPPDGNTWLAVFDNHAANPFVLSNLPYDSEKDLEPVLLIGTAPYLIATARAKPFQTLADVLAAAKEKPGAVSYASVGSGSVGHLAMALLAQRAGVKLVHVPYRGGGPAMTDALAGHVDLIIGSAALVNPQVTAKGIVPIMQTGKTRLSAMPDVQTAIEAGFPAFESYAWWGVFAPAGTPKPIIERFGQALADSLREETVAKQLRENLQMTMLLKGPEEEREFLAAQMALWGPVVRDNNIKGD